MSWRAVGGGVLTAVALSACAGGGASEFEAVAVDSAGVRVVANRGIEGLGPLGWSVPETPRLVLGGADAEPEATLYQVMDATRLADGRIVVANSGTQQIQVFSAEGQHLQSIGRTGDGPGEFRSVFWVGRLPGDSIAAWDPLLSRLSVFGPGGEFVRSVAPRESLGLLPRAVGLLPGGGLVVATGGGAGGVPARGEVRQDTLAYVVLAADGTITDTLGRFPGTETIALADQEGLLMRPLPFGRQTVTAVHDGRLYVGTGDRHEVAAYVPGLGLRTTFRSDRPRLPITQEDVAAYRRSLVTLGASDARADRRLAILLEEAPYPDRMPALADLEVDTQGNVWVQETRRPGEDGPATWTVFAPDGRARGTVQIPADLAVKEIGPDWVLGVMLDEDQAEEVRLYRLQRARE